MNVPGAHAEEWKINRHVKEVEAIMNEPMSESESQEAYEIGREWEKERGLKKGHIAGGREPLRKRGESSKDPEVKKRVDKFKDQAQKQIAASQEARRKVV